MSQGRLTVEVTIKDGARLLTFFFFLIMGGFVTIYR